MRPTAAFVVGFIWICSLVYLLVVQPAVGAVDLPAGEMTTTPTPLQIPTALPEGAYAGECQAWAQVNAEGFGLPSNFNPQGTPVSPPSALPYLAEDVFEVLVFRERLYLGMEADNSLGARLWRTLTAVIVPDGQSDWQEVAADMAGNPFDDQQREESPPGSGVFLFQNDHVDSLAEFHGYLYASTANGGGTHQGIQLYRSASGAPHSWQNVLEGTAGAGFGDLQNTNFKDITVFTVQGQAWLCGGTGNDATGAEIWCSLDGLNWVQKNQDGFGSYDSRHYPRIWSMEVFNDHLYASTECSEHHGPCTGAIFRTDGAPSASGWQWERVFQPQLPCTEKEAYLCRVNLLGILDGELYSGFAADETGARVYRTRDGLSWHPVIAAGFGDAHNRRFTTDAATLYNGLLYLATNNERTGCEVWRTDGTDWSQVGSDGFSNANPAYLYNANLIPFNGYLYAWAEDYATGQKVYRTRCPVCQKKDISGPGLYEFNAVGAKLEFAAENLDSVEVCVYPDAFPPAIPHGFSSLKRYFDLKPVPATGKAAFSLSLAYSESELAAAGMRDQQALVMAYEAGGSWQICLPENMRRGQSQYWLVCSSADVFSSWAILGEGATPGTNGLVYFPVRADRFHPLASSDYP